MDLSCIEINPALDNPQICIKVPELKDGSVVKKSPVIYVSQSGKFCIVYKFQMKDGTYKAVRVWLKEKEDIQEILDDVNTVSSTLKSINSQYFVQYDYHPDGILIKGEWRPMVVMDWCEGDDLKEYVSKHHSEPSLILDLAHKFLEMVKFLHENNISHGDLQHKNIKIKSDGNIVVLDYDSICVPGNAGKKEIIKGLPGYQLFRVRNSNECLSPKVDYYSELVIYVSLLLIAHHPDVWGPEVDANDNILLFTDEDIANINSPLSLFQKYKNDKEDNFFELVLELQQWFNFGQSIDDFSPLEKLVDGNWLKGVGESKELTLKPTSEQKPLSMDLKDILKDMI